jgi:predicted alpha/beta hydrolase family esterase
MEHDKLSCAAWVTALERTLAAIEGPVILVAHSAGVMIAVHGRCGTAVHPGRPARRAARLRIAVPEGYPTQDVLRENGWLPTPRARCRSGIVAASTNDPLGRIDRVASLAAAWGSHLVDVGAVGHLNRRRATGMGAGRGIHRRAGLLGCHRCSTLCFDPGWRHDFHAAGRACSSVVIAIAAAFIAEHRGGPTLLYALLLGMALNTVAAEGRAKPGVDVAARRILRLGVALLGARITVEQIGGLGVQRRTDGRRRRRHHCFRDRRRSAGPRPLRRPHRRHGHRGARRRSPSRPSCRATSARTRLIFTIAGVTVPPTLLKSRSPEGWSGSTRTRPASSSAAQSTTWRR